MQHFFDMENFFEVLSKTVLFSNIAQGEIKEMLVCLKASYRKYSKGEMIIWEGDKVNEVGILLYGAARSIKDDINGKTIIVTMIEPSNFIGIILACSQKRKSPVSVQALQEVCAVFFPIKIMIEGCKKRCNCHKILLENLLAGIAEKAMTLHDRNDCLIKSSIREKIITYLLAVSKEQGSKKISIPLDRSSMAEYLNVERSALSRELSKMKRDGLISYKKNYFVIF